MKFDEIFVFKHIHFYYEIVFFFVVTHV
jgi:hypothetical protein